MRYLIIVFIALFFSQGHAQNYTTQDMTLQLDENGIATLTPEDVLVNMTGTLWDIGSSFELKQFHYDHETQSVDFLGEVDELCLGLSLYSSYDRNPINRQEYVSGIIIDCCDLFVPFTNTIDCDTSGTIGSIYSDENECNFSFRPPFLFSFDRDGVLFEANGFSDGISTFDVHSNIRTFFIDNVFDNYESGLTYDFENHRLIGTTIYLSNNISFVAIDIETAVMEVLFELPWGNNCSANAIEYIGNDIMLVGNDSPCNEIYSINLVSQEITMLANNYSITDFLFIEDEIPDATLSMSQFTCSDVGEQTVDITVLENGNPVNYQATVNVVPDFSVRNCVIFRRLTLTDPNGSDAARLDDYTDTIEIVSSCSSSFTVIQTPPPGTLIPHAELVDIILTVTDEFGNTTICKTIGCSDSPLAIDDNLLQNNFVVYPNPTTDQITIENRNNISLTNIEILDINGRVIGIKEINSEVDIISMSLSSYSSGVYFVKINGEDDFLVKQIIKQ